MPFVASCILATGIYTVKLATQQKFRKGRHNLILKNHHRKEQAALQTVKPMWFGFPRICVLWGFEKM